MAFEGNPGTNKLAGVLASRMKQENTSPLVLDYGEILGNMSLKTNTFPVPIPKGQYSVCREVTNYNTTVTIDWWTENTSGGGGYAEFASHNHEIKGTKPERVNNGLKPGDRVLVAWINNDACVIDVIRKS